MMKSSAATTKITAAIERRSSQVSPAIAASSSERGYRPQQCVESTDDGADAAAAIPAKSGLPCALV